MERRTTIMARLSIFYTSGYKVYTLQRKELAFFSFVVSPQLPFYACYNGLPLKGERAAGIFLHIRHNFQ